MCVYSRREFDIAKAEIGIVIIVVVRPPPPLTSGCGIFFLYFLRDTERETSLVDGFEWLWCIMDIGEQLLGSRLSSSHWFLPRRVHKVEETKQQQQEEEEEEELQFNIQICYFRFVFLASQQNCCHVKCLDRELLRHTLWNDTRRFVVWEKDRTVSFTSAAIERQDRYNLVFTNWWSLIDLNSKIVKYLQIVAIKKFVESEEDPLIKKIALREIRMLKVNIKSTVTRNLG